MPRSIWSDSLAAFSDSVAATRPAPAGVAAAAVAAELGVSLLIKALSITGGQDELLAAARLESAHLRGAADRDIGAVLEFMRARDAAAMQEATKEAIEAPLRAARAATAGLELCAKASGVVKDALAADLLAAQALLAGSLRAIFLCVDANLRGREQQHPEALAERQALQERARTLL
ncbi:MAG TPA: cyclodeaminase/cyclohydrolase family protein [Bryobacteraceae bacterium]|jgi:formiminotetrahydrofolate cyclodeaminase